mgnify:CR=1 FL=1
MIIDISTYLVLPCKKCTHNVLFFIMVDSNHNEKVCTLHENFFLFLFQVHLIEGIIDQVDETVYVSWVQPRVLGIPQIKALRERLDGWLEKVHTTLLTVEAETPDLVVS